MTTRTYYNVTLRGAQRPSKFDCLAASTRPYITSPEGFTYLVTCNAASPSFPLHRLPVFSTTLQHHPSWVREDVEEEG
jgi:hypothetical protein